MKSAVALLLLCLTSSGLAHATDDDRVERATSTSPAPSSGSHAAPYVDLNNANATELMTLPGVGPKRAEAILARRDKGQFLRVTQLLEVKGIGKKTLERLKPHLFVTPPRKLVNVPETANEMQRPQRKP